MPTLSRREFAALAAAALPFASAPRTFAADPISAQAVIDRIRKNIGVDWQPDSVDTLKAGDASTIVTGIATTSMATIDVLQRTVKAGANFVVTAQPTFYARADSPDGPPKFPDDPIVARKKQFIADNRLVIFRLSDHWRLRRPDPFAEGLASTFGWTKQQSADDPLRYDIPARTLESVVSDVNRALRSRGGIRVVGDRRLRVSRIGLMPGTTPIRAALDMLPNVDVIVAGEVREWETVEYVRDKIFAGEQKALILVGRVTADEPGMAACANWLKSVVPEVTVRHLVVGDPYWRPAR
jgi:hypothetical protein